MVPQSPSISPTITATSSSSSSSSSSSTTSTPTSPIFPSIGDSFKTREELSTLIKGNGKAIGYIFKCSVTSEYKVTYYCSNKYHAPRCMAGFKAAYLEEDGWIVTEATEHNDGCTRLRQRVNGIKTIPSIPCKSSSTSSKNRSKSKSKGSPVVQSRSQDSKNSHTTNASLRASISSVASSSITRVGGNASLADNDDTETITTKNSNTAGFGARKHRSYSASTGTAVTSPPSSIFSGSRRGSLPYNTRRTLREVDENEALQDDDDDEHDDDVVLANNRRPSTRSVRSALDKSQYQGKNDKKETKEGGGGGRDRSSSSVSSQSTRSESSRSLITTILDPAFHFPPATLEASAVQKALPCRRKRSASYIKNNATTGVLLGRYLESQKEADDMVVE